MKRLTAIVLFTLFGISAFAELTPGTPAPDFPKDARWLGGGKLSFASELKGKVVLVDFWEYTCINCIRTFPHLKELYARYHQYGFEIVGVHKGEFGFASRVDKVALAYKRFKLPYPTVIDVSDAVWTLYDCNSWPDSFLIDRDGVIRDVHQGEGDYGKLEREIQHLLKQKHPDLDFSNITVPPDNPIFGIDCGQQSEEIYVGYERGSSWGGQIANKEGFRKDKVVAYARTSKRVERGFFVEGKWRNDPDDFESVSASTSDATVSLGITYFGRDAYAVLGRSSGKPVQLAVTRDGMPLPASMRGQDVKVDKNGQTLITIDESRMYYVVTKEDDQKHELKFFPQSAGVCIFSFTFGNKCLENFGRL